jgi:hypothetical protein
VTEPLLLSASSESGRAIVGAVALSFTGVRWPDPRLVDIIAQLLTY